jgi:hypothetical protein
MVKCPVCGTENSELNTVCVSCKGFIQAKVDTLDLFSTSWGLLDEPQRTFKRIAIARSKNYAAFLSAFFGVALMFAYFWHWHMAVRIPNLMTMCGIALIVGLPLGIVLVFVLGFIAKSVLSIGKLTLAARNCRAVIAYAAVPVVATVFIVLPLEIAVFGAYFFDTNPPPNVINPAAYIGLMGADSIAALCSFGLLVVGLKSASGASWLLASLTALVVAGVLVLALTGIHPVF